MLSPDYDAPSPVGEDEMELRLPDEEDRHTPPGTPCSIILFRIHDLKKFVPDPD